MPLNNEYNKQLEKYNFQADPEQKKAVEELAKLQLQLKQLQHLKQSFAYKAKSLFGKPPQSPLGCYIWGDVGRGKTWLMDMFFNSMEKDPDYSQGIIRLHFHHFMQAIHDQLSLIGQQKHPLKLIAKSFAKHYQLLCLDEFHVSDITDAMLLYGLLETLLEEGVVLVATSNQAPDDLYKNGLQRQRFLPAIKLIKQYTVTLKLDGKVDHRLRLLEKADTWQLASPESNSILESRFLELITSPAKYNHKIHINYRQINSILYASNVIWLDFHVICGDQRGSADYIEIARQFHTVFIGNIPKLTDAQNDKAKRFINMIDEFYDRNVNLIVSAEATPEKLYSGKQLTFEFKRTISRLQEMRSHEYMQRPHKIS